MKRPHTVAIVAMTASRVIGRDGRLPWHLPEDLRFFRRTTTGTAVLMGRKTWNSLGRPLPRRRNIVLSRTLEHPPDGAELIRTPEEAGHLGIDTRLHVIGGAEIYRLFLPRCDELLVSFVFAEHEGDTFFPPFEDSFALAEILERHAAFEVRRYVARRAPD